MEGVITAAGRTLPAFHGFGSGGRSRGRYGRHFAQSSELHSLVIQALQRYQNAIDTAQEACDSQSTWTQGVFNWITGNTSTQSICMAVDQMRTNHAEYSARIADPETTDEKTAEILSFVNKEVDIRDLLDTAQATGAWRVVGDALVRAPGTAIGLATKPAGEMLGSIFSNIPWWVWLGGAGYLAFSLGVFGGAARRIRERVA